MQVLIAEDDSSLGLFLQKGLKLEGHEVTWVGDGQSALDFAQEHRPDLIVLDLSLQWNCPVLDTRGFSASAMALGMPRLFVEEFGALPLRVAGNRMMYVAFEDRLDASVALALERMSDLKVQSGLLEVSQFRGACTQLLGSQGVTLKQETLNGRDALMARIASVLDQKLPLEARLVRVHQYYWLRLWLESGATGRSGRLPVGGEDMVDYVFTVSTQS
jgi:CheY-like chemotaxis protein